MSKYRCPKCGRLFEKIFSLKRHFKISHLEEPTRCPVCGKTFLNDLGTMAHLFQTALLDDDHAMYYYLYSCGQRKGYVSGLLRRRGMERLKVN
jgi:uncharacterized C2H2 Zn-finger protein